MTLAKMMPATALRTPFGGAFSTPSDSTRLLPTSPGSFRLRLGPSDDLADSSEVLHYSPFLFPFRQVPAAALRTPLVTAAHFERAVRAARPTVSTDDLALQDKFTAEFGSA